MDNIKLPTNFPSARDCRAQTKSQEILEQELAEDFLSSLQIGIERQMFAGHYEYTTRTWTLPERVLAAVEKLLKDSGFSFTVVQEVKKFGLEEIREIKYKVSWA